MQSVGTLQDLTQKVKIGSEAMHESHNLERLTQEITGGMNEMAGGAEQINAAVHNVNEMTQRN